jgi:hypothetical protein
MSHTLPCPRKTTTVLPAIGIAAALLASACIREADERIGDALPTPDGVSVKLPDSATRMAPAGATIGATQLAELGQLADWYVITRQVTRELNAGAGWVLLVVHVIVQFPPTTVDGNVYTWGPHSEALDPAEWRLIVTANADGTYDWQFEGRSKITPEDGFLDLITGHAVPGRDPHRGSGSFLLDFDNGERVNPIENDARGTVSVTYDLENRDGSAATLDMIIDSVQADENGGEQDVHFEYGYAENRDGSGDFQFVIHGDVDDGGSAFEDAGIRSRWQSDGQGRADIQVQAGDLGALVVTASECWDAGFGRVYYSDNQQWQPTEGVESDCAFAAALLPGE